MAEDKKYVEQENFKKLVSDQNSRRIYEIRDESGKSFLGNIAYPLIYSRVTTLIPKIRMKRDWLYRRVSVGLERRADDQGTISKWKC